MDILNIVSVFNKYKDRIQANIATCGRTAMSLKLDKLSFAFVLYEKNGKELSKEDVSIIDLHKSSDCEISELHRYIYMNNEESNAVIHTHTPYAAAIGKTEKKIPPVLDDAAQIIGVDIRCSDNNIVSILKVLKKRKGCIIKENGTITHGRSLDEAYTACLVLEKGAKTYISARILGNFKKIPYFEAVLMHFIYQKKYSKANQSMLLSKETGAKSEQETRKANYSKSEKELRELVVDSGKKLLNNNLVQGTWGNISVRLDDEYMLITPSGLDYLSLTPDDIVKQNYHTMEYVGNLKPSGEKDIHATLLRERKDINAVIHSHPNDGSAYAASNIELPAINDEMQQCIKGNARVSKYALPSTMGLAKATVEAMDERNACFMANHGMIAVGATMDEAFKCSKILEKNSGDYIDQKASEYTSDGETSEQKRINAYYKIVSK